MRFDLKDSGKREEFSTGSLRDTREGKGRYDLLSPFFLERLSKVMEKGASKYGERNWELGQPFSRALDSVKRHINQYFQGLRDEDHLAHAAFGLMACIHFEELISRGMLPGSLNDLPCYSSVEATPILPFVGYEEYVVPTAQQVAEEALYLTDIFLLWLASGPRTVQETFDHFHHLGWSDDDIIDTRQALMRAGKVEWHGGCSYKLTEPEGLDTDLHGTEILSFDPPS